MREDLAAGIVQALRAVGLEARVTITNNRVRMLSASRRSGALHLRVAAPLAALGEESAEAIAAWAAGAAGSRRRVRGLLKRLPPAAPRERRPPKPVTAGVHHDLEGLLAAERARYLPDVGPPGITWGPRRRPRKQRGIRLGSYDPRFALIRVHRRLDDAAVPGWFVGFVIYHELLHHALGVPSPRPGARRPLHSAEFRRRERLHHRYADAMAWEADELPKLLARVE